MTRAEIDQLAAGLMLRDYRTRPGWLIADPQLRNVAEEPGATITPTLKDNDAEN